MDFSKTLIHCSSLSKLMSQPRDKAAKDAGELSASAKTHLIEIYVTERYKRIKDINTVAMSKGTTVEEDSITILSRYDKELYLKNRKTLSNDYIIGTPDIILPGKIIDAKSSWDLFTFKENLLSKLDTSYYWQVQGYMSFDPSFIEAEVDYCLIDTPDFLIDAAIKLEMRKLPENMYEFVKETMHSQLKFTDVPFNERVIKKQTYRCQEDIDRIPAVVTRAREFLQLLYDTDIKNGRK